VVWDSPCKSPAISGGKKIKTREGPIGVNWNRISLLQYSNSVRTLLHFPKGNFDGELTRGKTYSHLGHFWRKWEDEGKKIKKRGERKRSRKRKKGGSPTRQSVGENLSGGGED